MSVLDEFDYSKAKIKICSLKKKSVPKCEHRVLVKSWSDKIGEIPKNSAKYGESEIPICLGGACPYSLFSEINAVGVVKDLISSGYIEDAKEA